MRVLVTGATGFLGREVTHQLGTAGHDVTAFTHSPGDVPGVHTVHGDLTDTASVRAAITDAGAIDAVCHLAALTQARESRQRPLPYWDVNTAGTLRLLQTLTDQPGPAPLRPGLDRSRLRNRPVRTHPRGRAHCTDIGVRTKQSGS